MMTPRLRASLTYSSSAMKLLCVLALGLAVVAAELSVDVTPELDRMAKPEDRSVTAHKTHSPKEDIYFFKKYF